MILSELDGIHGKAGAACEVAAPCRDSALRQTGPMCFGHFEMEPARIGATHAEGLAWYCARTKPKHEHTAAANLRKNLKLEVFHPRLRVERATRRGVVRIIEPLFPCYLFVRCDIAERHNDIRHTNGVSSLVHFGHRIPMVADSVIEELQECFEAEEPMTVEDRLSPGDEVVVTDGAFAGMHAFVLRAMPARQRVQVLLDILGGPTPVEVDRGSLVPERSSVADRAPLLAAPQPETLRV